MFIDEITSSGAMPALEATMRFAGARQKVLAHNIANLSTPDFRPMDVSTGAFQAQLQRSIEQRRERNGGQHGELGLESTREVQVLPGGGFHLRPRTPGSNVLFHDRNNRDVEKEMQALVENVGVFRAASDLMRHKFETLKHAMMGG